MWEKHKNAQIVWIARVEVYGPDVLIQSQLSFYIFTFLCTATLNWLPCYGALETIVTLLLLLL